MIFEGMESNEIEKLREHARQGSVSARDAASGIHATYAEPLVLALGYGPGTGRRFFTDIEPVVQ